MRAIVKDSMGRHKSYVRPQQLRIQAEMEPIGNWLDNPIASKWGIEYQGCLLRRRQVDVSLNILTNFTVVKDHTYDKPSVDRIEILEAVLYLRNLCPGWPPKAPCVRGAVAYDGTFPCHRFLCVLGFKNNACPHRQVEDPGEGECGRRYSRNK